jgi:dihydrofolate reductase
MKISIIAAVADNGVIGVDNRLPWHLGADMKHFKTITTGHTILMGKNTYLSIGKAFAQPPQHHSLPFVEVGGGL